MEGIGLCFKNYYARNSFMWCPLTLPFRPQNRYEYHGMNNRLYANFRSVNNMRKLTLP